MRPVASRSAIGPRGAAGFARVLLLLGLWTAAAHGAEPRIPPPRGFVNDFAGVIDAGTANRLDALIRELRDKTGAEIAVVTVDSTRPLTAFDYAIRLAESWKPGTAGKDNGVVFLVAVGDRELFIATGYGIEGALPDGLVGEIRDRLVVPRFKRGDFSGGIRAGTEALAAKVAEEYGVELSAAPRALPARRSPGRERLGGGAALFLLLVLIFLFRSGLWPLLFLPRSRHRFGRSFGGGGFGGHGGGFGGGGFGGFGGGGFGGGGAGGRW